MTLLNWGVLSAAPCISVNDRNGERRGVETESKEGTKRE